MHKIRLTVKSESMGKIGPFSRKDYIVGQRFKVWFKVENIGETVFPGAVLWVNVQWPNEQLDRLSFPIEKLPAGESQCTKTKERMALARGFALFYAQQIIAKDFVKVEMFNGSDKGLKESFRIDGASYYRIYYIYAKPTEEITEYWAMWISAISLLLFVIINLVQFISWLIQSVNSA